jgi:O-antigen/teichoic acid export membrane protein
MPGARRSGRAGAAAAAAAQAAGFAAAALVSFVLARKLGAAGTGTYAVAGQFTLAAMMVGAIGLRTGVAHEVSAGRLSARAAATESIALATVTGSMAGIAAFGLYELGSDSVFEGIEPAVAVVLCASIPFATTWWVLAAIPLAQEDYEAYAVLQSTAPILVVLVVPLTLAFGIDGALIGLGVSLVVAGLAAATWALRWTSGEPGRGGWQVSEALRVGLRGWPLEMLQLLQLRPDVLIVAAYVSTADTGVYSLAVIITTIGWILPQALGTVALPRTAALVASEAKGDAGSEGAISGPAAARALRHGTLLALAAGVVVAVLLVLAPLIFGQDFERTLDLGMIMLPGAVALALGRVMIALLLGLGRAGSVLALGAAVVPAALAAYLLVVPGGCPTAAAIVSCAAYLVTTAGAVLALRRTGLSLSPPALIPRRADLAEYASMARTTLRR